MSVSWVLVADSSRAKILQADTRAAPLHLVETFEHAESRMKNSDFYSDGAGRSFDSGGQGRHAMESEVDAKTHEAQRFAKELCEKLRSAALEKRFEHLYIIAAPSFLGFLRECLDAQVKASIAGEIPKDVVTQSEADIRKQLPDFL